MQATRQAGVEVKNFGRADETRTFEKGKLELVRIGNDVSGKATLQPGWKWSLHVKPIANTQSCEAPHFQYQISGRMHVRMDDGTEFETGPGDVIRLAPGHDAWVVGNEPVVVIDWAGMAHYAEKSKR